MVPDLSTHFVMFVRSSFSFSSQRMPYRPTENLKSGILRIEWKMRLFSAGLPVFLVALWTFLFIRQKTLYFSSVERFQSFARMSRASTLMPLATHLHVTSASKQTRFCHLVLLKRYDVDYE